MELRLDPPHLGKVKVNLTIEKGVLHSEFTCSHEASNQIRQNLNQLRADLAGQGITLGQASVNDSSTNPDNNRDFNGSHNPVISEVDADSQAKQTVENVAVDGSFNRLNYLI